MVPRKKESHYQSLCIIVNAIFSAWLFWQAEDEQKRMMMEGGGWQHSTGGAVLMERAAPREPSDGGVQSGALF